MNKFGLGFGTKNNSCCYCRDKKNYNLCPNADEPDNEFQIGFSVGKYQIPMIHVRDKISNFIP